MMRFWVLLFVTQVWAQSPAFEVASIRPTVADGAPATVVTIDDAGVRLRLPLQRLVCLAYEVTAEQISGPSWLTKVSFDIEAKLPASAKRDQIPAMLRNLLADRFGMSVHRNIQLRPVYALVVAKGGLKMKSKPADADTPPSPSCAQDLMGRSPGTLIAGDSRGVMDQDGGRAQMSRVSTLVNFARMFADRPVIDMSNLHDLYDIKLDLPFTVGRVGDPAGGIDPVMVNALEKLGLKLEPQKAPIEMIVIDRIQPTPQRTEMERLSLVALLAFAAHAQSFEVASIRPHAIAVDQPMIKQPDADPIHVSGNRITLEAVSLNALVMAAYGVKEYQVSGGPAWASRIDNVFDIAARAPSDARPSPEQVRAMLQSLLAERFHLRLRHESKQLPVYNLVVAKGGLKIKRASEDAGPAPGMRRGSMDQLAALLSLMVDRPVLDKTGLAGAYDYPNALTSLDVGAQDSADTISRTLAAMQEQLGLRAESARATIDMLVIENADKPSAD